MRRLIIDEQRDISYGELVALQQEFETQLDENGVIFDDDESYDEALGDFIQQYMEGDDNPMIDLSAANVRPVRDSKRRQVRDSRRPVRNMRRRVKDSEDDVYDAIQELYNFEGWGDLDYSDVEYYGDDNLEVAEMDNGGGCYLHVFKSIEDAYTYVKEDQNQFNDYLDGAMRDDEWVDYLVNGGVNRNEAEQLVSSGNWQKIKEIILDTEGAEWFLGENSGKCGNFGNYVIYY